MAHSSTEFSLAATEAGVDTEMLRSIAQIKKYDDVEVSIINKAKTLRKFGRSLLVDSSKFHELWPLSDSPGSPFRPSSNLLDTLTSSSGSDTMQVLIEGHTISNYQLTFVTQTATVNGQNEVTLGTPLARCTRIVNQGNAANVGNLYVFDNTNGSSSGVPTTAAAIGGYVTAGDNQTQQAFTSISKDDYWLVEEFQAVVNKQQTAAVDVRFEYRKVDFDGNGTAYGVWLPLGVDMTADSAAGPVVHAELHPNIIIPANSDVRVTARGSSASDTQVSITMGGHLATIV